MNIRIAEHVVAEMERLAAEDRSVISHMLDGLQADATWIDALPSTPDGLVTMPVGVFLELVLQRQTDGIVVQGIIGSDHAELFYDVSRRVEALDARITRRRWRQPVEVLVLFMVGLFATTWIVAEFRPSAWVGSLAGAMVQLVFLVPWVIRSRRLNHEIRTELNAVLRDNERVLARRDEVRPKLKAMLTSFEEKKYGHDISEPEGTPDTGGGTVQGGG